MSSSPLVEQSNLTNVTNDDQGNALDNLGKSNEVSIVYYDKALAIEPSNTVVLENKGIALSELGRYEEAITYYDKALALVPEAGLEPATFRLPSCGARRYGGRDLLIKDS